MGVSNYDAANVLVKVSRYRLANIYAGFMQHHVMKTLYNGRMVKTCFSVVPESENFITKNTLLPLSKCRDVCVMVVKSVSLIIAQLCSIRQYKVNFYPLWYIFCKSHGMICIQLTKQSWV
jgi:hypothetical protein